jgi:hypothetical protein
MDEQEIRQSLLSVCEILKAQTHYYWDVHRSMIALSKTVFSSDPDLQTLYNSHWESLAVLGPAAFGSNTAALLEKLDEIIRKLKG